jgi:hypothetical protein
MTKRPIWLNVISDTLFLRSAHDSRLLDSLRNNDVDVLLDL